MRTIIDITGGEGENANTLIVVHSMPDTRRREEQSTPRARTYGPAETKSEPSSTPLTDRLTSMQAKAWDEGAIAALKHLGYQESCYQILSMQMHNPYEEHRQ
ncbi:MAG: hypothetical protein LKI34_02935 [Bifidobacterium tibiigranuli]|jgi:hypothetical protein|uniref:hypothetical protein n=1 Tax=Bifidobacterium tibiigranuli TaxID=2172043 RepID=UPI0026EBCBEB|nr:hypothetical protein [Bifidobacterium tibiigranuli]MCI1673162.1 hypothetical protein [Bifidobacterium tibiigranuli]MCI1713593.1 hypothetical protein [Bifidobacterium tibiigranuli]